MKTLAGIVLPAGLTFFLKFVGWFLLGLWLLGVVIAGIAWAARERWEKKQCR